jgi:hypothetical protein
MFLQYKQTSLPLLSLILYGPFHPLKLTSLRNPLLRRVQPSALCWAIYKEYLETNKYYKTLNFFYV